MSNGDIKLEQSGYYPLYGSGLTLFRITADNSSEVEPRGTTTMKRTFFHRANLVGGRNAPQFSPHVKAHTRSSRLKGIDRKLLIANFVCYFVGWLKAWQKYKLAGREVMLDFTRRLKSGGRYLRL